MILGIGGFCSSIQHNTCTAIGCHVTWPLAATISSYCNMPPQGRRKGLGIGGAILFYLNNISKGYNFVHLIYLWFPTSTELWAYSSLIAIHLSIYRYLKTFNFGGLAKYWGGGKFTPSPFLQPCLRCRKHRYPPDTNLRNTFLLFYSKMSDHWPAFLLWDQ